MVTVRQRLLAEPPGALCTGLLLAAVVSPNQHEGRAHRRGLRWLGAIPDLGRLARMTPRQLRPLLGKGLGDDAGCRLTAAFELGRRVALVPLPSGQAVRGMSDLEPHLRGLLASRTKEVFVVLLLDARNRLLRSERISEGCLTWSVVHPREVFAPAVREAAAAVIVAHNHPSGDPAPSPQDLDVTQRLVRAGETLGIPLLDHIVVGRERCVSLRAQGHLGPSRASAAVAERG